MNCLPGRWHIKCQTLYSLKKINKMSSAAAVNSILWVNIIILRTLVCVVDFTIPSFMNLICIWIQYRLQPSGCQSQSDRPRDPESWKHIYQIYTHMRFFCLHTTAFYFVYIGCLFLHLFLQCLYLWTKSLGLYITASEHMLLRCCYADELQTSIICYE